MTTLAAPSVNSVRSTLAASFTRGTDTTIVLNNGTLFPSPTPLGLVVHIHETDAITSKFCLVIYTSKAADTLTMGGGATDYALVQNVSIGDETHEFPIGSIVDIVVAADEIGQLFAEAAALKSISDYADSPMIVTGGVLTGGSTPGTFKTTALTCLLRVTDTETGKLEYFSLAEQDDQAITAADTTYYVILTYDGDATPTLSHNATRPTDYRSIVIGLVMKTAAPITHYIAKGNRLLDGVALLERRAADLRLIELASGCAIAWNNDVADNEFTITKGVVYQGIVRLTPFSEAPYNPFNSNDDEFVYAWRDTGTWQYTTGSKVINALYFDDNTADAGHPGGTLISSQYGVAWVYIHPDENHVYVVYGRDSYKLAEAEQAQPPGDIPTIISNFGLLIGKIIIVQGGTSFAVIQAVGDTFFTGAAVADHGEMAGLDDLDHPAYMPMLDPTLGSAHSYSGPTATEVVGETVVFGELLYFNCTAGRWKKADADLLETMPAQGIALEDKGDGEACLILLYGFIRDDSWAWTVDDSVKILYASVTPGEMSEAAVSGADDFSQVVAMIRTATTIFFNPSLDLTQHV